MYILRNKTTMFCGIGSICYILSLLLGTSANVLPDKIHDNGNVSQLGHSQQYGKEIALSCSTCYGYECCDFDCCGFPTSPPCTTERPVPEETCATCEPCEFPTDVPCTTVTACPDPETPTEHFCPTCEPCYTQEPCYTSDPITCPPVITCPPEKTCPPPVTCPSCPTTPAPCPTEPVHPIEDDPKFSKTFYQSSLPSWPTAGTTVHFGLNATTSDNMPLRYQLVTSFEFLTLSATNDVIFTNNVSDGAYVGPNNVMVIEVVATVIGDESRQGSATVVLVFPRSTREKKYMHESHIV